MKKILIGLAIVAFGFSFAACNKTCNCKTYLLDEVVTETTDVELPSNMKKCSDMNTVVVVAGKKSGMECK